MKKSKNLKELNLISEIEEISRITQGFNKNLLIKSIGDDAAIFKDKNNILISADSITENVHFRLKYYSFKMIGAKSLLINLSDIAAMGGVPRFFILSLLIPDYISEDNIKQTIKGIIDVAKKYKVTLIGGNISRGGEFSVSITIIGDYTKNNVVKRHFAKPCDFIFISGNLGNSWLSFYLSENKKLIEEKYKDLDVSNKKFIANFVKKFILPVPKIELGKFLAVHKLANTLTDISDGLFKDISNLLNDKCGAKIFVEELPLNDEFKKITKLLEINDYFNSAISYGEDYELLWTSSPDNENKILQLSKNLGIKITKIGEVTKGSAGVDFLQNNKKIIIKDITYHHI